MNLCKLLKGHEGETFYTPMCGEVKLIKVFNDDMIVKSKSNSTWRFDKNGKINIGFYSLYPSKDQRDWNKWAEEQKPKTPKTWDELTDYLCNIPYISRYNKETGEVTNLWEEEMLPIEKSALALLKIHQLIESSYGGNITAEEWSNNDIAKYIICKYDDGLHFFESNLMTAMIYANYGCPVAFHTEQQRDEFLSYPENIQLLKDFYML